MTKTKTEPDKPRPGDIILTVSSAKDYAACRRKYWYKHDQLWIPQREADPLQIGHGVHHGLFNFYSGVDKKEVLAECRSLFDKMISEFDDEAAIEKAETNKAITIAMMIGYMIHHDAKEFEEILPETEFLVKLWPQNDDPLENEFAVLEGCRVWLAGKMDGLIKINGQWWLFEHKTYGDNDFERVKRRHQVDIQNVGYLVAAEQMYGVEVHGALYNFMKKPIIRMKKSETEEQFKERLKYDFVERPEMYYRRHWIYRNPQDRQNFYQNMLGIANDLKRTRADKNWYQNFGNCMQFGACPYLRCCMEPDNLETTLKMGYKKSKLFSELDMEVQIV